MRMPSTVLSNHSNLNSILITPITGPSFQEVQQQIEEAPTQWVEIRFDLLPRPIWEKIPPLLMDKRKCYTFRRKQAASFIQKYPADLVDASQATSLVSSHYKGANWKKALQRLLKKKADLYKFALYPASNLEALEFLCWAKKINQAKRRLIPICLGEKYAYSRPLAMALGAPLMFTAPNEKTRAYGQLTYQESMNIYRTNTINQKTQLFGLIGDPVDQSVGHIVHNKWFKEREINALYLKIPLDAKEVEKGLLFLKQLDFKGLSVTMPLKQAVLPYVKGIKKKIAINTLVRKSKDWKGYDTDSEALHFLLEKKVGQLSGQRVFVVGTGGVALSSAQMLKACGANVTLVGRNREKVKKVAELIGVGWQFWDRMDEVVCDILVLAIPIKNPLKTKSLLTVQFLQHLKSDRGDITGEDLFFEQAKRQQRLWFA